MKRLILNIKMNKIRKKLEKKNKNKIRNSAQTPKKFYKQ